MTKIYSDTNPTAQSTPSSLLLSSLSASLSHLSAVMLNEQQLDGSMASSFFFFFTVVFEDSCVLMSWALGRRFASGQEKRHTSADPLIFALTACICRYGNAEHHNATSEDATARRYGSDVAVVWVL